MQSSFLPTTEQQHNLSFLPVQQVTVILDTLRKIELSWIADEIETAIQRGRLITKEYAEAKGRKPKQGYTTIPFQEDEQLDIALKTIRTYFVVLNDAWVQAQENLS